jgi:transketolase C-terminal domain/subunit
VHTVKPLDKNIIKIAKKAGAVVTVEEHQIAGGLGSAIAELLALKPLCRLSLSVCMTNLASRASQKN